MNPQNITKSISSEEFSKLSWRAKFELDKERTLSSFPPDAKAELISYIRFPSPDGNLDHFGPRKTLLNAMIPMCVQIKDAIGEEAILELAQMLCERMLSDPFRHGFQSQEELDIFKADLALRPNVLTSPPSPYAHVQVQPAHTEEEFMILAGLNPYETQEEESQEDKKSSRFSSSVTVKNGTDIVSKLLRFKGSARPPGITDLDHRICALVWNGNSLYRIVKLLTKESTNLAYVNQTKREVRESIRASIAMFKRVENKV